MTEFALVLPLLITMFLFAMFFAELTRARLKMLEVARYVGWEATSYPLDDYGNEAAGRHDTAFGAAKSALTADVLRRFDDLDSVDARSPGGLIAGFSGLTLSVENRRAGGDASFSTPAPGQFGGRFIGDVLGALNGSTQQAWQRFGFNLKGQISVEVSMKLDNRMLPRNFADDSKGFFTVDQWGGSSLQQLGMKSRVTLIASGWQLPDGSDALMNKDDRNAGVHRGASMHGLWLQVNRMTHLGLKLNPSAIPGVAPIVDPLQFVMPQPFSSTFVTAHNYQSGGGNGGCDQDPSHPAPRGLNNLGQSSVIDWDRRKCYETLPFRDQTAYDSSDGSLQVRIFEARGRYFMGCQNAQADDPTHGGASPLLRGDLNSRTVACGGEVQ